MKRARATKTKSAAVEAKKLSNGNEASVSNGMLDEITPAPSEDASVASTETTQPVKAAAKGRGRKKMENTPLVETEVEVELPATTSRKAIASARGKKKTTVVADTEDEVKEVMVENVKAKTTTGRGRSKKETTEQTIVSTVEDSKVVGKSAPAKKERGKAGKSAKEKEVVAKDEDENGKVEEPETVSSAVAKGGRKKKDAAAPSVSTEESVLNDESSVEMPNASTNKKSKGKNKDTSDAVQIKNEKEVSPKKSKSKKEKSKKTEKVEGKSSKRTAKKEDINEEPSEESPRKKAKKDKKEHKEKSKSPKKEKQKAEKVAKLVEKEDELPTTSGKRSKKAKETPVAADENQEQIEEPKTKRGRKRVAENDDAEKASASKKVLLNAVQTKYEKSDFDFTLSAPQLDSSNRTSNDSATERFNLKISSWNVAGLRSWLKKDGLTFLEYEEPDIFCLQETKCTTEQLPEEAARIPGYHPYWLCLPGGYAGVAIYSKIMPINVEYGIGNAEFDDVGRIITAEYEKFFLVNVYVPNSGRKLVNLEPRMRWEKLFQEFVKKLDARKPVIISGDMNVSHLEIDLANPKTNTRNAGFTKEERDKMTELLSLGFVDTFRQLYPERTGAYTFWTYMGNARSRNVGWRLDYFIVSERFAKRVVDNCIRSKCLGSDHCPITLFLKL